MVEARCFQYDAATAMAQGRRDRQEDAVATLFPPGLGLGCVVLADGMGGHASGHVASAVVVREMLRALSLHARDAAGLERDVGAILHAALERANDRVARLASDWPDLRGMGATLVAPVLVDNRLYWISVGDSPLYLLRGARMARLNQEHSLAGRMERLVSRGLLARHEADNHPDRDCLTSVVIGKAIPEIDCQHLPLRLLHGDILIAASDGLQFLDETRIAALVHEHRDTTSAEIAARLMQEIRDLDDPDQDNVSICIVKIRQPVQPSCETAHEAGQAQDMAAMPPPAAERTLTRPPNLWKEA